MSMATMQLQSLDADQLEMCTTSPTPPLPIQPPPNNGIVYGFRTRHLSCIEENDSDSLHGSSVPRGAYDLMQQADETFKKLNAELESENEEDGEEDDDDDDDHPDTMPMIDESRLGDADYLDELVAVEQRQQPEEDFWQPSFNRNDIMMTSCYGTLNSSFGEPVTPRKAPEPLYATPEKRRESNRSFDSTCNSQASSLYGGSMNSSLDLKYMMSVSLGAGNGAGGGGGGGGNCNGGGIGATSTLRGASVPPLDLSLISCDGVSALDWSSASVTCVLDSGDGNPAEELNGEMAAKCLSAAESGKW
ncbi:hypothetical protein ACLKA7_015851 [Drosophila subpalustris]